MEGKPAKKRACVECLVAGWVQISPDYCDHYACKHWYGKLANKIHSLIHGAVLLLTLFIKSSFERVRQLKLLHN